MSKNVLFENTTHTIVKRAEKIAGKTTLLSNSASKGKSAFNDKISVV